MNKEEEIRVSVIVPIYKAENTIRRCVNSLLSQNFKGFEVILIDDGSPDECPSICDELADNDKRIRVIHQKNGGVALARQVGVDAARGEYTIHADPDDWVDQGMLSALFAKAKETNADMLICDYWENTYKGQRRITQKPASLNHNDVLRDLFTYLHGSTWNKLIRKICYEKYDVKFPKGVTVCEDLFVCASLLKHNVRVSYLNEAYYHYERPLNTVSLSKGYTGESYEQDRKLEQLFHELLQDTSIIKLVDDNRRYFTVMHAFYYGLCFYTSKTFRIRFGQDLHFVWHQHNALFERLCLFFSCMGCYRLVRNIFGAMMTIKHKINF